MTDENRRLIIFDIDGTLLLNGPVAKDAFLGSFERVCGRLPENRSIMFAGMTDRGIFKMLLERAEIDGDYETLFDKFRDEFIARLKQTYPSATQPYLLPGVTDLLKALHEDSRFILALGTGNIRETAYLKLAKFNLGRYFPVGGFGGDHRLRADVIRAAIQDARAFYRWNGSKPQTWVIGDTDNDVFAAHEAGARALAVATGFVDEDVLLSTDAEYILDDLSDTQKVIEILTQG